VVIFFTVTLGVSIAGMILLLVLKRYELNSGRVLLGSARPAVGHFFHRTLSWFEYVLPGLARVGARRLYATARRVLHVWAARFVVKVEQGLEQALRRVRGTTAAPQPGRETSAFLREVAEHKKKLQEDLPDRSTVIEE
jgi:hypothetical protein